MNAKALACALLSACLCQAVQARDYRYSDAHLHYVDFFQESEGMPALLKAMDAAGVDQSMISGIPVAKWHEDEPSARVTTPVMMPMLTGTAPPTPMWRPRSSSCHRSSVNASTVPERVQPGGQERRQPYRAYARSVPGYGRGIGEVFTRHDDLTALTSGETPRANEAMTRIYHLAAERDLPVLLHSNITSKRERNPLYLAEIEEPLRNHPHTRFIWAHAGSSMEIHRHQTQMDFLLPVLTRLRGLPEPVCRSVVECAAAVSAG